MQKKKLKKKEVKQIVGEIKKRFGMPENVFKGFAFFKTKEKIYVTTKACVSDSLFKISETAGLALVRINHAIKPTTDALQLFGIHATQNTLELTREELEKAIKGESVLKEIDEKEKGKLKDLKDGFVIMKYKEHVLGCGYLRGNILESMIPKSRRALLRGVKSY